MSKIRPVLVLFDLRDDVIVCRLTSAQHSGPLDVVLTGWQADGLLKPSIARLNRLVTAVRLAFGSQAQRLWLSSFGSIRRATNITLLILSLSLPC